MDFSLLQLLRLVHIVSAAAWMGIAVTLAFFVHPAIYSPDVAGSRLMRRVMMDRRLATYLPLTVLLALISGFWLFRIDFPDMSKMVLTPRALDYTLGAFLGVIAFFVGIVVNLPTAKKIVTLGDFIGTSTPSNEQTSELARLGRRLLIGGRSTAILTLGAAALMALARNAQ
jgi:hypothetical protein